MELVWLLVLHSIVNHIHFKACHIASYNNAISDSISRNQWTTFLALTPKSNLDAIPIPEIL